MASEFSFSFTQKKTFNVNTHEWLAMRNKLPPEKTNNTSFKSHAITLRWSYKEKQNVSVEGVGVQLSIGKTYSKCSYGYFNHNIYLFHTEPMP